MINSLASVPVHVGIIMDGNGRWAEKRGLPRTEGHKEGVKTVKRITIASAKLGIKYLTLFAFSTENWKRDASEVEFLFSLFVESINSYLPELKENSVRLNFLGKISDLPFFVRSSLDLAKQYTKDCSGLMLNIAINYGGRHEIIDACKMLVESKLEVNERNFESFLYTAGQPDPDLIIRTSGEKRLSNFLLYQSSYAELAFTDTLWPDFSEEEFLRILQDYSSRKRKFGGY